MSIIQKPDNVRKIYQDAASRGWVIPCMCTENLTTTEAILTAAEEFRREKGFDRLPVILAMTVLYDHRSQAVNYTHTRRWDTGLKLFTESAKILSGKNGPFQNLDVMLHLDHIQHDLDMGLLNSDLSDYASIMYDASVLPLEENMSKTAEFVKQRGHEILIEGACDEILDATGDEHNDLTTPQQAFDYINQTNVEWVVCNLGTEHRASGKELKYHGEVSRSIREKIGHKIVLHGTSSVTNDQLENLYKDGVCKVNIWTALERDSSPTLFDFLSRNPRKVADKKTVDILIDNDILVKNSIKDENQDIKYYTTVARQEIIFKKMKEIAKEYFEMWYV